MATRHLTECFYVKLIWLFKQVNGAIGATIIPVRWIIANRKYDRQLPKWYKETEQLQLLFTVGPVEHQITTLSGINLGGSNKAQAVILYVRVYVCGTPLMKSNTVCVLQLTFFHRYDYISLRCRVWRRNQNTIFLCICDLSKQHAYVKRFE